MLVIPPVVRSERGIERQCCCGDPCVLRTDWTPCRTGVGPDLFEAARDSVRSTVTWLGERHGLDRQEAYALASVACDLRIHEVVDAPNWVVGCFVPESIFEQGG